MKRHWHPHSTALQLGCIATILLLNSCLLYLKQEDQHFFVHLNEGGSIPTTNDFSREVDVFALKHGFTRQPSLSNQERLHIANIIILNYRLDLGGEGKAIAISANYKPTSQVVYMSITGPSGRHHQDMVDKLFEEFRQQIVAKYDANTIFSHIGRVPN